jgi:hypothetical protein
MHVCTHARTPQALLTDQARTGTDDKFLASVFDKHQRQRALRKPRVPNGTFGIAHYAGEVWYTAKVPTPPHVLYAAEWEGGGETPALKRSVKHETCLTLGTLGSTWGKSAFVRIGPGSPGFPITCHPLSRCQGMRDKNLDALKDSMRLLVRSSETAVVKDLIEPPVDQKGGTLATVPTCHVKAGGIEPCNIPSARNTSYSQSRTNM